MMVNQSIFKLLRWPIDTDNGWKGLPWLIVWTVATIIDKLLPLGSSFTDVLGDIFPLVVRDLPVVDDFLPTLLLLDPGLRGLVFLRTSPATLFSSWYLRRSAVISCQNMKFHIGSRGKKAMSECQRLKIQYEICSPANPKSPTSKHITQQHFRQWHFVWDIQTQHPQIQVHWTIVKCDYWMKLYFE